MIKIVGRWENAVAAVPAVAPRVGARRASASRLVATEGRAYAGSRSGRSMPPFLIPITHSAVCVLTAAKHRMRGTL